MEIMCSSFSSDKQNMKKERKTCLKVWARRIFQEREQEGV